MEWGSPKRAAEGGQSKGVEAHQDGSEWQNMLSPTWQPRGSKTLPRKWPEGRGVSPRCCPRMCCLTHVPRGAQDGGVNPLSRHPPHLLLSPSSSLAFSSSACAHRALSRCESSSSCACASWNRHTWGTWVTPLVPLTCTWGRGQRWNLVPCHLRPPHLRDVGEALEGDGHRALEENLLLRAHLLGTGASK